jgi:hypothetical protein
MQKIWVNANYNQYSYTVAIHVIIANQDLYIPMINSYKVMFCLHAQIHTHIAIIGLLLIMWIVFGKNIKVNRNSQ